MFVVIFAENISLMCPQAGHSRWCAIELVEETFRRLRRRSSRRCSSKLRAHIPTLPDPEGQILLAR